MKHIYSKNVLPYFQSIMPELKIIADQGNNDYTFNIISYLFEAGEIPDQDDFIEVVKTGLSVDEKKIMTLAQQYEARGLAKGRAEGRAEGQARGKEEVLRQMTINMLNKGMDSKEVAQIANIAEDDLRLLLAKAKKKG